MLVYQRVFQMVDDYIHYMIGTMWMVMVLTLAPEFGWCIQCIPSHPFFSEPNFGHVPRVATGRRQRVFLNSLSYAQLLATATRRMICAAKGQNFGMIGWNDSYIYIWELKQPTSVQWSYGLIYIFWLRNTYGISPLHVDFCMVGVLGKLPIHFRCAGCSPQRQGFTGGLFAYIATPYFPASNGKWSFHDYDMVYIYGLFIYKPYHCPFSIIFIFIA